MEANGLRFKKLNLEVINCKKKTPLYSCRIEYVFQSKLVDISVSLIGKSVSIN